MFYGAPVTAPMEIPAEVPPSYTRYDLPEIGNPHATAELPEMVDASLKGIRLQGTLAKALPGIKQAGYMTNVRQMDAIQLANDMRAASGIMKPQAKRSRAIARAKNYQMEKAAKPRTKEVGKRASAGSRRNSRYAKNTSFNAAYQYGYDPNQSMRR